MFKPKMNYYSGFMVRCRGNTQVHIPRKSKFICSMGSFVNFALKGPGALNDTTESPGCFNQILNSGF